MQDSIIDTIKDNFYPDKSTDEIENLIKHFHFTSEILQAGPSLFIDGLQGSIPAFLKQFNDYTSIFPTIEEATSFNYGKFSLVLKEKAESLTDNDEKRSNELIQDHLAELFRYEERQKCSSKEKEFLDFLNNSGVYTPGKPIIDNKRDADLDIYELLSESEAKKIDELYNANKTNHSISSVKIDIEKITPFIERAQQIGEKYDLGFLNVSLLDLIDTENLSKKLDDIETAFSNFKNRFHLENESVGYGRIGYMFDKTLLCSKGELAHFSQFGYQSHYCGAIRLKSNIDHTREQTRIIDHEYAHSIDMYLGKKMGHDEYFSELPYEEKIQNPKALEALRKIIYSVSDLENEYLSIEEANQNAFEFNKDMFKTLLIHSFSVDEYAKLDQKKINQVINNHKDQVVKTFDAISWLSMENKKEFNSNFLSDFSDTNAFANFYNIYKSVNGQLSEEKFLASLEEPLNIIKENIYDYNIKRDLDTYTFFKNPSDFAKDIANVSINIKTYTKESSERLAWAVGGTDKEDIIPGVLQGFKDLCEAANIIVDNTKILNKDALSKKLKDLQQLKMPSYLYTIKYDG